MRPDGKITVPLVGEIQVRGLRPAEVRQVLAEGYEKFVTAPTVSVVVEEINSRRVFIVGEVAAPGVYDILHPTKLMQLLAMAGGLTDYAKKDEILILRDTGNGDERLLLSIKAITSGKRPEDNIRLQPRDTVVVP